MRVAHVTLVRRTSLWGDGCHCCAVEDARSQGHFDKGAGTRLHVELDDLARAGEGVCAAFPVAEAVELLKACWADDFDHRSRLWIDFEKDVGLVGLGRTCSQIGLTAIERDDVT